MVDDDGGVRPVHDVGGPTRQISRVVPTHTGDTGQRRLHHRDIQEWFALSRAGRDGEEGGVGAWLALEIVLVIEPGRDLWQ